ncbi:MAG TPA: CBS domain-containing protein [Balneola sp.]|jgi:CBS domain-containing protein/gamma-glutamylcysteine synthetase|nr:CBS domain-containing protein [Balneola sp.]MAO78632.1 CBS domain-containing protein [Balneola sp.]MBF63139.1 CBS domain-containing protein [Balneola sp.]HAH51166.1 CBS domain-containing protein [Balneola sp.]|tara:strand:+ start:33833 stop:35770 length:1938 start_codon:yes stop_codon:yes gene_type:complete
MGEERVKLAKSNEDVQRFMKNVLKDARALEKMLEDDWFETDVIRIGAEQELCLIDEHGKAMPNAMEVMDALGDGNYTTEIAKFNIEINLDPLEFKDNCLSQMEENLQNEVAYVREKVQELGGDILLTGILPSIRKSDVAIENLTPLPRYKALCDAIDNMRGKEYEIRIQGMDELLMKFDTPLLEGCNTGYQIHLQIKPDEFVSKYNIAQAIAAPVLASAVNSPILLGKRLWAETRIALFHQSVDTRGVGDHLRDSLPRVTFGSDWLRGSILDIYKEDISRYRVLLSSNVEENVDELLKNGIPPKLMALNVHNGTVYRWNRPCYGIGGGKPHLRIENRVLPSGPTVVDEIANTAFWLGLMNGMEDAYSDITKVLDFDNARLNFFAASKMGLDTKFIWTDDRKVTARDLIKEELLPIARAGLEKVNILESDINTYLGVIEDRVESAQTGSYWVVKSYGKLIKENNREQTLSTITGAMAKNQQKGEPVHKWGLARIEDIAFWRPSSLLVEEFMTTDLFTARKDDLIEFASNLLDWRRIRYIPIEDDQKHLVGLVSMRMVLREYSKAVNEDGEYKSHAIEDIMINNPITIHPEASIIEAMEIMQDQQIGCLPVVKNSRLVGIITEDNFLNISRRLIKALANENKNKKED